MKLKFCYVFAACKREKLLARFHFFASASITRRIRNPIKYTPRIVELILFTSATV